MFLILSVAISIALNPCIDVMVVSILYDKRILQPCKLSFLAQRCKAKNIKENKIVVLRLILILV